MLALMPLISGWKDIHIAISKTFTPGNAKTEVRFHLLITPEIACGWDTVLCYITSTKPSSVKMAHKSVIFLVIEKMLARVSEVLTI